MSCVQRVTGAGREVFGGAVVRRWWYSLLRGKMALAAICKWRNKSARTRPRPELSIRRVWTSWRRRARVLRSVRSGRCDNLCVAAEAPKTVPRRRGKSTTVMYSRRRRRRCVQQGAADESFAGNDESIGEKRSNAHTHARARTHTWERERFKVWTICRTIIFDYYRRDDVRVALVVQYYYIINKF
jgi:hypothetical protein